MMIVIGLVNVINSGRLYKSVSVLVYKCDVIMTSSAVTCYLTSNYTILTLGASFVRIASRYPRTVRALSYIHDTVAP